MAPLIVIPIFGEHEYWKFSLSDYSFHFNFNDLKYTPYMFFNKFQNFHLSTRILFFISLSYGIFALIDLIIYN